MATGAGRVRAVDQGEGTPLVLVPGVQGRWEYMRRAVDALSASFRVITFSLCGERASGLRCHPSRGLDDFVAQIETVLDERGVARALVCGVSFGGLVALRFAASRPERTQGLVLASTPGPGWHLKRRHEMYSRLPWLFAPIFLAEAPWRLRDELHAALPDATARRRFRREQLRTLVKAPVSPARMAERARLIGRADPVSDCRTIAAPTLVITGEEQLDHVVSTDAAAQYGRLIRGARTTVIQRTGHLGCVTRPEVFADRVREFWRERAAEPGGADASSRQPHAREDHDAA